MGYRQALLLPNWIAGFAGLAGFAVLYFGRVAREERMMLETLVTAIARIWRGLAGSSRRYSEAGSDRYWIFGTTKRPGSKRLKLRAIFATFAKKRPSGPPIPHSICCCRGERQVI